MAPHSSTFAWKIPWTEEPGGLQSMGFRRVGHDWATSLSLFTFMHWKRKWQPTPVFLPGESQGRRSWWAAVYGVAQSRTRLKRLSSSSSSRSCIHALRKCSTGIYVYTHTYTHTYIYIHTHTIIISSVKKAKWVSATNPWKHRKWLCVVGVQV